MQNRFGRLLLGINAIRSPALGPHDTRAGRIIRPFLPSATKVELLRRSDGASRRTRAACSKTLSKKRTLSVPDLLTAGDREDRGPIRFRIVARRRPIFSYSTKAGISSWLSVLARKEGEAMIGHDAQVVLALGISVTLSLIAWGWARRRLRKKAQPALKNNLR